MAGKQFNSVEVQVLESELALLVCRDQSSHDKKMETRLRKQRLRSAVVVCFVLALGGIIFLSYFCPDQICALSTRRALSSDITWAESDNLGRPLDAAQAHVGFSYDDVVNDNFQFDMNAHDVMVFLHIQKTGGTSFGKHLVRDLDLQRPCSCHRKRKRCYCFRPNSTENWLFSRYSTGWKCGLHADWTELTNCVDAELDKNEGGAVKRRYGSLLAVLFL